MSDDKPKTETLKPRGDKKPVKKPKPEKEVKDDAAPIKS